MACINPDGTISESARNLLKNLSRPLTAEEIAPLTGQPLFKVRSSLRELVGGGLVLEAEGKFSITENGRGKIQG
jgi:predicted transcriptional regulator